MNKKEHLILGFSITGIIFIYFLYFKLINFTFYNILIYFIITFVSCLLPDIDHKSGTITWTFLTISFIGINISHFWIENLFLPSIILLGFSIISPQFFKHRGFTHTILFGGLITFFIIYNYNIHFSILFISGFYSHLIGDKLYFKLI